MNFLMTLARRKIPQKCEVTEMLNKEKEYTFVLDANGTKLDPTIVQNAWRLVRQKKAKLISKFPMVIQLNKVVDNPNKDEIRCGIDDGAVHVGIALVQKCKTKNKVLFKGTIEQRKDVKKLMDERRSYRQYRRKHKRHRPARFNNRASSKRRGRLPPSIKQKKQAIIRVIGRLLHWINIESYWLEDVKVDVRALTDGYKPYKWQYQKSNRLDENLRKATILRDDNKCMVCGKSNCRLEVHHITPKRLGGINTLSNLITLCEKCHKKTYEREMDFAEMFYSMIDGKNVPMLKHASHVMQGKTWLQNELRQRGELHLTIGADTANKRIDWGVEKTHSNDAICITDLMSNSIELLDWCIKPMRRQNKAKTDSVLGIRHRDLVEYTYRNGETYKGYVTALCPDILELSFQSPIKKCCKVNAKKCKLLWKFDKIYWFKLYCRSKRGGISGRE